VFDTDCEAQLAELGNHVRDSGYSLLAGKGLDGYAYRKGHDSLIKISSYYRLGQGV
jgi:hypothetical protein